MGVLIFRLLVVVIISAAGYFFPPFQIPPNYGILTGFILSVVFIYLETRIRKSQFKIIWSSTLGTFAGVLIGWGLGTIYQSIAQEESATTFIRILFLVIMPYIGFLVGSRKPEWLDPPFLARFFKE